MIDRLETLGYVRRLPDPEDRRATIVEITDAGRGAMADARVAIDEVLEVTWGKHATDEESVVVIEVMERVLSDHLDDRR